MTERNKAARLPLSHLRAVSVNGPSASDGGWPGGTRSPWATWERVRARAGLKDVRIHDLRHTFASTAVASGQGLPIGKLLGHTQVQTTARYAHLADQPVKDAADQVAGNIGAWINRVA